MSASEPPTTGTVDDIRVRASDRPPAPARELEDADFVQSLRSVGLVSELDDAEHERISTLMVPETPYENRRVDLLLSYYGAAGHFDSRRRREQEDRFFWHSEESPTTLRVLIGRIGELTPELQRLEAVWTGPREAPTLRLRTVDDHQDVVEDVSDQDEFEVPAFEGPSVTVLAIVRAVNMMLARKDVARRFVPLAFDGDRETYVAIEQEFASMLCAAELIEESDEAELNRLAAW